MLAWDDDLGEAGVGGVAPFHDGGVLLVGAVDGPVHGWHSPACFAEADRGDECIVGMLVMVVVSDASGLLPWRCIYSHRLSSLAQESGERIDSWMDRTWLGGQVIFSSLLVFLQRRQRKAYTLLCFGAGKCRWICKDMPIALRLKRSILVSYGRY